MNSVADQRIRTGASATLTAQILDAQGDPVEPTGAVTVAVAGLAAPVLAAGTATGTVTGDPTLRTVTVPARTDLDLLTATWSEAGGRTVTTRIDVAGGFYASTAAIRDADPSLAAEESYPTAKIIAARRAVEDEFERVIGYALVPRVAQHVVVLDGEDRITLPHFEVRTVRSVTLDGAAIAYGPTLADAGVVHLDRFRTGTATVVYEHGWDRPTGEAVEAFFLRVRDILNRSKAGLPSRTTTYTSEVGGTYSLAVAGRGGSLTGIPDVDVVLQGMRRPRPGIA